MASTISPLTHSMEAIKEGSSNVIPDHSGQNCSRSYLFNQAEAKEGPAPGVILMPEGFGLSPHLFLLLLLFGSGVTVHRVLEGKT